MKKMRFTATLLLIISLSSFGQTNINNQDSANKKPALPKDRNMFRLGVPRGLIVNNDGLADGYVLYSVPNSASIYLINRKGEVVHEWKSTYGSPARVAYLQGDGSIIDNAVDPDFPVFAGGGESGRIEKITWDNKVTWDFEYATEEYL